MCRAGRHTGNSGRTDAAVFFFLSLSEDMVSFILERKRNVDQLPLLHTRAGDQTGLNQQLRYLP